MNPEPLDLDAIRAAARLIQGLAHRTPVATCRSLDALAGKQLFFKCEHLQRVGAFKFRGAAHAVARLDAAEAARGVLTHSSGNHAQALALAASLRGVPAHIVMPSNAPGVKRRAVRGYHATIHPCEPTVAAREAGAARVGAATGAVFVHPYDHPYVIAGQGTATLELLEQVDGLDAIVAPVGGGGLLSGTCIAGHGLQADIRVFGAEPQGADDAARSLAAGRWLPQDRPETIADGLRTSLGTLTWPIVRDHVEAIDTVSEQEIVAAMRLAWERAKLLIEPSAAVAVAAVLGDAMRARGEIRRVGVILSGGNVDLDQLPFGAASA